MMSVKLERVLDNLSRNFQPFTLLSRERLSEVVNTVRFVEMRQGEIFQITGGKGHDYLFVVEGQLEIIYSGAIKSVAGPDETRKHPLLLPPAPSTSTLVARQNSIICHADRDLLDKLISWDEVVRTMEDTDVELYRVMEQVRNSLVFRRLPLETVEMAFKRMKCQDVKKGQEVIRQGEAGDAYYIITAGTAEVFQRGLYDDKPHKIADLKDGDAFGCEALISGKTRSETVRMTSDGTVLVLDKQAFEDLISTPLIKSVHPSIAKTMLETGYGLIDVRYSEEFDEHHIPCATLIPLYELRNRIDELDKSKKYIVYCHGGARSAVATLILTQNQIDVVSLEGGIRNWPFETQSIYEREIVTREPEAEVLEAPKLVSNA
ncbi:MAG: cyclic nucleotide-binding domain-containing protein [Gammaproteobacteria bacterium]|nr:cyclic nucleotide-binding domain-containing protein [Gammaproteobacteria bacterium]